jgi:hypothetical protein
MPSFYALVGSAECWGIQIVTIRYFSSFGFGTPCRATSYPGYFASGKRKWPWHRPVTWPQNLQYLGCSIMIIYTYKYVYRIIIYILITDRSKLTQWCVYNQRESDKISWLYSVFVVYSSFSNIARNIDDKTGTPKFRGSGCQFPQSQCHPSPRTGIALGTRLLPLPLWDHQPIRCVWYIRLTNQMRTKPVYRARGSGSGSQIWTSIMTILF